MAMLPHMTGTRTIGGAPNPMIATPVMTATDVLTERVPQGKLKRNRITSTAR